MKRRAFVVRFATFLGTTFGYIFPPCSQNLHISERFPIDWKNRFQQTEKIDFQKLENWISKYWKIKFQKTEKFDFEILER